MKIFLVTDPAANGYDVYDAFVCIAATPDAARRIHPRNDRNYVWSDRERAWFYKEKEVTYDPWPAIDALVVEEIGEAPPSAEPGRIILSSFNAG